MARSTGLCAAMEAGNLVVTNITLVSGGQPGELAFHVIDLRQIDLYIMVATALMGREPKSPSGKILPRAGAAEMDDCREFLFSLQQCRRACLRADHIRHLSVEQGRRELNRVAGS